MSRCGRELVSLIAEGAKKKCIALKSGSIGPSLTGPDRRRGKCGEKVDVR
jgi:hypothetical protein